MLVMPLFSGVPSTVFQKAALELHFKPCAVGFALCVGLVGRGREKCGAWSQNLDERGSFP